MQNLLNMTEAAAALGMNPKTFANRYRDFGIPVLRLSERTIRFRPEDIESFVKQWRTT